MKLKIFNYRDTTYQKIYFISNVNDITKSIGYIDVFFENGNMIIGFIQINKNYRNRGYAQKLITYVIKENKENIRNVMLEDNSEKLWKNDNLYIKLGFKYIGKYPEKNMILLINEN